MFLLYGDVAAHTERFLDYKLSFRILGGDKHDTEMREEEEERWRNGEWRVERRSASKRCQVLYDIRSKCHMSAGNACMSVCNVSSQN